MALIFMMRLAAFVGVTMLTAVLALMVGALLGATGVCPSIPEVLVYPYLALQFVVPPLAGAYVAFVALGPSDSLAEPASTDRPAEHPEEPPRGAS